MQLVTRDGEILADAAGWGGAWAPHGAAVAVAQPDAPAIVILGRDGTVLGTYETGVDGGLGELARRPGS